MPKAAGRELLIDHVAAILRKPSAGNTVTPAEAIAIALSSAQWAPGMLHDPDGDVVQLVIKSLKDCGWKIEPI